MFLPSTPGSCPSFLDSILMTADMAGPGHRQGYVACRTHTCFSIPGQHAYLVHSLPQHLAHKLKELQVILMDVGCGRRVESLVPTGRLQGTRTGRGREVKCLTTSKPGPSLLMSPPIWLLSAALPLPLNTLNRLSAGSNTLLMISSKNSLKTPS